MIWDLESGLCKLPAMSIAISLHVLPILTAALMMSPVQSSCQGQTPLARLVEKEERAYVLAWRPPDTPILSYRRIIRECDRLLAEGRLSASDRQHLLFCRGIAKWCRADDAGALRDFRALLTTSLTENTREIVETYYALIASTHHVDRQMVIVTAERLQKSLRSRVKAMAHVLRSYMARGDRQWLDVLEHTDVALRLDPQCEPALVDRAYALWKLGQVARAADTMEQVRGLTVHTDRIAVEQLRMLILTACGKTEEAAAVARRAAMRFEDRALMWGWVYQQEQRRNNRAAARIAALRAFDANPTHPISLLAMAHYYLDKGRIEDARHLVARIPEAAASVFFNEWGMLSLRIGLGDKKALSRAATHPERHRQQTELWRVALYLSSHTDDSIRNGRKALNIISELAMPPTDSQSYSTCRAIQAVAYAECGEWESASATIHDAIDHASSQSERERLKVLQAAFARRRPYRLDPKKGVDQPLFVSFFSDVSASR